MLVFFVVLLDGMVVDDGVQGAKVCIAGSRLLRLVRMHPRRHDIDVVSEVLVGSVGHQTRRKLHCTPCSFRQCQRQVHEVSELVGQLVQLASLS